MITPVKWSKNKLNGKATLWSERDMSEFNDKLLEHFRNPRNVGVIDNADGFGRGENPVNGYLTDMYIKVENEQIKDVKFKTFGCVVTIASASALSEVVKGKTLEEVIDSRDSVETLIELIKRELGDIPERNWHCLPTAVRTLLFAISDYYRKNNDEKNVERIEKTLDDVQSYFEKRLEEEN